MESLARDVLPLILFICILACCYFVLVGIVAASLYWVGLWAGIGVFLLILALQFRVGIWIRNRVF